MADDWVEQRFKRYQDRLADEARKRSLHDKALASYDALFDKLQQRVDKDVTTYNRLFGSVQDCKAVFRRVAEGFEISRNNVTTYVKKNNGTVINVRHQIGDLPRYDTLEVAVTERDAVGYKHEDKFLSVDEASEAITGQVLCQ
jgi:hypothetical protein